MAESGSVLLANTSLGTGSWTELEAPVNVNPTGSYGAGSPSCPSYSSPIVPSADGTANLTKVQLWDCGTAGGQQWRPQANGSLLRLQRPRPAEMERSGLSKDVNHAFDLDAGRARRACGRPEGSPGGSGVDWTVGGTCTSRG
jgi:hypothetical protein